MENASKALIIGGGILIAIMLLTLFTYLFGQTARGSKDIYTEMEQTEIAEFNQQFLNYEGKFDLTIQDVVTIVNLAQNNNKVAKVPTTVNVKVGGTSWTNYSIEELNNQLVNKADKKYECHIKISDSTLLVYEVNLEEN